MAVDAVHRALVGPNGSTYIAVCGFLLTAIVGLAVAYRVRTRQRATKHEAALESGRRWQEQEAAAEVERQQQIQRDAATRQRQAELAAALAREQAVAALAEQNRQRLEQLVAKYGPEAAERIFAKEIWLGATKEMVIEALGKPDEVSEKVLKTKTKSIFKYFEEAASRPRVRVTFDNDEVVGWEK